MGVSEQKLNEILKQIIAEYRQKGSISTNTLCDILEKIDTSPDQIDYIYKSIGEAGIQIVDEDERDRELFEQALRDIGLDDPVKMYLKDIGRVPLLSVDEEIELARKMQDGRRGGKKAPLRGQPSFVGFHRQAIRRQGNALPRSDSGGQPRLMKAVEKFDYQKGFKFSTYAPGGYGRRSPALSPTRRAHPHPRAYGGNHPTASRAPRASFCSSSAANPRPTKLPRN